MKPESLTKLRRIEEVLREYDTPMARYLADSLDDVVQGRPEDILKLHRIENTLRAAGKPAAVHLADDIHQLIDDEVSVEGLAPDELAAVQAGRPIDAIKLVRSRKGVGGNLFGLKEAKDFVEKAAQRLGYFHPEATGYENRWTR